MSLEDDVRSLLHAAADDAPAGTEATAVTVIDRYHRRRAQRLAVAGIAAALLLLGGLPLLGPGAAPPAEAPQLVAAPDVDVLVGPPRGNLAGDEQLLDGLLVADWTALRAGNGQTYDPPAADRSVVFAGDIGNIRTALVTATVDGQRVGAWFTGSRGAPADQLRLAGPPAPLATNSPVTRLDTTTSPAALVVIGAPGDAVLLSEAVVVAADGTLERRYRPLTTVDGVATATVDSTTAFGVAASVRIDRHGAPVFRGAPAPTRLPGPAPTSAPVRTPHGAPQPPAALVEEFAADLARATGLEPATLKMRALWSGALPAPDGGTVPAAVLAATYPSGAVAVAGGWTPSRDGGSAATWCTFAFRPVGSGDEPVAMRCTVSRAGTTRVSLVLLPPASAAAVEVLDEDGSQVGGTVPLARAGVVPGTGTEDRIRFLATDGRPLTTADISPWFSGDLGRYGTGSR
jgi:hypothetical protein